MSRIKHNLTLDEAVEILRNKQGRVYYYDKRDCAVYEWDLRDKVTEITMSEECFAVMV